MIGFYERTIVRPFWSARVWAFYHPWWTRVLTVAALCSFFVLRAGTAYAAVEVINPLVPPGLTDSYGIDLRNYGSLPIDTGGITDPIRAMVAGATGFLWSLMLAAASWTLWLIDWVLKFEWLALIVVPFNTFAETIEAFLGRANWIGTALMLTALFGGAAIVFGKVGRGVTEMLMGVLVAILAFGILSNPVAAITAVGGALDKAREFGGQLAALATTDDFDAALQVSDPSQAASNAITAQLADILVRIPAETISFGKPLPGSPNDPTSCAGIFAQKMIEEPPPVNQNTVKDAVRACDEEVKKYSENLNFTAPISALFLIGGAVAMFALPLALLVLLLTTIIGTLFSAAKSMLWAHAAVAPINRYPLWRSMGDTVMGLAAIMVIIVLLGAMLKIVAQTVAGLSDIGVNLLGTSVFSVVLVIVVIVLLVRARNSTLNASHKMAQGLSKMGLSSGGGSAPSPVAGMMTVGAALYGAKKLAPVAGRAVAKGGRFVGNAAHKAHGAATAGRGRIWDSVTAPRTEGTYGGRGRRPSPFIGNPGGPPAGGPNGAGGGPNGTGGGSPVGPKTPAPSVGGANHVVPSKGQRSSTLGSAPPSQPSRPKRIYADRSGVAHVSRPQPVDLKDMSQQVHHRTQARARAAAELRGRLSASRS